MTVSVLMGIYNCESTLSAAIESILGQTFSDWELIMCDDGSSDHTYLVASTYAERFSSKIQLMKNERNKGLNYTLNRCLAAASGDYIARMDGDDISYPTRFEEEVSFLDQHPQYALVSTPMVYFDEYGEWGRGSAIEAPERRDFIQGTPFCHAPCMIRKSVMEQLGGYSNDPHTLRAEDYDLWFRLYASGFRGYNLSEPLYKMRDDQNAIHRRTFRYAINEAYVRFHGYRLLSLPLYSYIWVLRPIVISLLPKRVYKSLHQRRQRERQSEITI